MLYIALLDFLKGSLKFVDEFSTTSALKAVFKQSHVQDKKVPLVNAMAQLSTTLGAASDMLNLRKDQVEKDLSILNKISSLTFKERHEGLRDVHVAGTGRWILDDKKFQGWIESRKKKASVLWCYGIGSSV